MNERMVVTQTTAKEMQSLSGKLSHEGMAKALRMFGNLEMVTANTRLISAVDCDRIEASIDVDLRPCTREEGTTLVAELLGAYPDFLNTRRSPEEQRDFQVYALKLLEAFLQFSWSIGKAIVHGGTGIPSKIQFKPRATDIITHGQAEKDRRINVKTMVQRHRAEAKRREDEATQEEKYNWGDPADRAARVKAAAANFKNNIPPDPIHARTPKGEVTEPRKSTVDTDLLLKSHDAGMRGDHRGGPL